MRVSLVFVVFASVVVCACPSSAPPATTPTPTPVASEAPPPAPSPIASSSEVPVEVPPGAAVKSPVFSDDDCSKDDECTGLRTCHPDKCVAIKNAGTMPAGMMCTMDCRGGTLDCNFNHCGCAADPSKAGKKKCAVLPGPMPAH